MPVPSNPTLRDVWVEYGGSGTLREYVRGGAFVPIDSSASIDTNASSLTLRQFAGTSKPVAFLDVQFVTTSGTYDGSGEGATEQSGYYTDSFGGNFGSISDGTFNPKSGLPIRTFFTSISVGSGSGTLFFQLNGTSGGNDGWTTATILAGSVTGAGGGVFLRQDATYFTSGGNTTWLWNINAPSPLGSGAFQSEVFRVNFT